jgi:hypothetical protein
MSVTDSTRNERVSLEVTGFWHQPLQNERGGGFSQRSLFFIRAVYVCVGYSLFLELPSGSARKALTSTPERHGTIKWPVRRKHRPINPREVACVTVNRPINSREVACVSINRPIKPMHREVRCVRKRPIIDPRAPRRVCVTIVWAMVHGVTVSAAATVMNNRHITVHATSRSRCGRKCETRAHNRHRCILLSVPHRHILLRKSFRF